MSEAIINAQVATIIDDTTLVLSAGSDAGVREGVLFAVVARYQQIVDPETGENLGQWESVKARVVVVHVQERMCTARSPVAEEAAPFGTLSAMMVRHSFGLYGDRDSERQPLSVKAGAMAGRPQVLPIEVGDSVRSVSVKGLVVPAKEEPEALPAPDLPSGVDPIGSGPHFSP